MKKEKRLKTFLGTFIFGYESKDYDPLCDYRKMMDNLPSNYALKGLLKMLEKNRKQNTA